MYSPPFWIKKEKKGVNLKFIVGNVWTLLKKTKFSLLLFFVSLSLSHFHPTRTHSHTLPSPPIGSFSIFETKNSFLLTSSLEHVFTKIKLLLLCFPILNFFFGLTFFFFFSLFIGGRRGGRPKSVSLLLVKIYRVNRKNKKKLLL